MELRRSALSMIVPELLAEHNYKTWRIHMERYLCSEGLWGIVSGEEPLGEGSSVGLGRRNAAALHAILMSCGTEFLRKIETVSSAKRAWEILWKWFKRGDGYESPNEEEDPTSPGEEVLERHQVVVLIDAIRKGDLDAVENILNSDERRRARISKNGYTALHAAISSGPQCIVDRLIDLMSLEQLEIRDKKQRTALALAAYHGKRETARRLIRRNRSLLDIEDGEGNLPLLAACQGGHVEMTRLLWTEERNHPMRDVASFVQACIKSKMFDIAWHALQSYRIERFVNYWGPHLSLAEIPSAFFSGSRLVFWQRWIYYGIQLENSKQDISREVREQLGPGILEDISREVREQLGLEILEDIPSEVTEEPRFASQEALQTPSRKMKSLIGRLNHALEIRLGKMLGFIIFHLDPPARKHMYELKLTHDYALNTLRQSCLILSNLQHNKIVQSGAVRAMFNAIKNGIVEFVEEIIKTNPDIIWMVEESTSRDILMCAIAYRQEKIARFIYELDEWRDAIVNLDTDRNNLLHIAGKLAPDFRLSCISGAALQMQRELQWFKEVESIVPEYYKECKNDFRKTPGEVFSEEHKDLQRKAEEWMKLIASSYTVVGALIITVMFAAAFTVPGGNNQEKGFPIFLPKTLFKIFIISDAISLSAASTSVLMFLGILTSRYAEQDFLVSLPSRLIIGLSTLFISIAMMMVAFSTALVIMLEGRLWIIIVMVVLSYIPIGFFAFLQFPLLVEILNSTYRWKVFKK